MIVIYRMFFIGLFLSFTNDLYAQSYHINQYNNIDDHYFTSVIHIIIDKNENIWMGTHGGLFMYNGMKLFDFSSYILQKRILQMFYDKNLELLHVLDGQSNYYQISTVDYLVKKRTKFENDKQLFRKNYYIDTVLIAHGSNIVVETKDPITNTKIVGFIKEGKLIQNNNRLFLFHGDTLYELLYENEKIAVLPKIQKFNLSNFKTKISTIAYNEKNGRIYFGSYIDGLFEANPKKFTVVKPNEKFINKYIDQNLSIFYSQCEDDSGNIYINNHLMVEKDGNWSIHKNIKEYGISVNYKDKNNRIWLMDAKTNRLYQMNGKIQNSVVRDSLHDIFISATETMDSLQIFISSSEVVLLKENEICRRLTKENLGIKTEENLTYIYNYGTEKKNKFFLLSNKNIYQFDLVKNKVTKIDQLKTADYRIMQSLNGKHHFISTYGQGYFIFDGEKWTEMPLDSKGYLKFAHAALLDNNGHVWISSNNGLFRTRMQDIVSYIEGKTKEIFYFYYDKSSGFNTNEFNGGCQSPAIKLKDGKFSFSSMDGLVQFNPNDVPALFPTNPLQLFSLYLNSQKQKIIPKSLVIDQTIKDIKFEFTSAYYDHPNNFVIEYMLNGWDDTWKPLDQKSIVNLQNITYGQYVLKVRKREGFENDAFSYFEFPIEIVPYLYQKWWFKALLTLIGLSLTYIFSRWYSRYMIQKNMELEILILERNKEVLQTNEVLQEQVKQNDLFQSIFVHDIKSPIRFITSNTALLKTHWNNLDSKIKQDQISHVHDAVTKIDHFIEETLLWIKIRNGELHVVLKVIEVTPLIQECIDFYGESYKILKGDIQIFIDVRQDLYLTQDERLLATIIRNLISNSIKYTAQGQITVYFLSNQNGSFTIGCKDTGKGMPKSMVEKLLSDHYRGNDIRDDSFKMGYVIIKEIVRLIGGQLHIESEENYGTNVWVVF